MAETDPGWLKDSVASLIKIVEHPVKESRGRRFRTAEIHEYRTVPFIAWGPGFGILHEGRLLVFPWDRLYEVSFEGESRDRILDTVRVMSEDQRRTLEGVRRSQQTAGPERA